MTNTPLIECQNISYKIGRNSILEHVNMHINQGEIVTIIGPNGGGKTTLVKIIIGILHCSKGKVVRAKEYSIGYTPQKIVFNPLIPITVLDFLLLNCRAQDKDRMSDLIKRHKLERILHSQLHNISGGEVQRVMLSKALLRDPDLLILDEPTQALDIDGQMEFYKFLEAMQKRGDKTIVIISHDLHTVMRATQRVICLNKTILCSGAPEDVERSGIYNKLFFVVGDRSVSYYTHKHKR